jgi:hypothetical protein
MPRFFGWHIVLDIEVFHLTCEMSRQVGGVEFGNSGNTGLAGHNIGPALSNGISNGRNMSKARNYDTAAAHDNPFFKAKQKQKPQLPQKNAPWVLWLSSRKQIEKPQALTLARA